MTLNSEGAGDGELGGKKGEEKKAMQTHTLTHTNTHTHSMGPRDLSTDSAQSELITQLAAQ